MQAKNASFLRRLAIAGCGLVSAVLLSACGTMSSCEKGTALGAGVGGVAGSVLSGGSTVGTVGGAVAGGVVGNRLKC